MNPTDTEAPTEILPPAPATPQIFGAGRPAAAPAAGSAAAAAPAAGSAAPAAPATSPSAPHLVCADCRAPVDREQRYCVNCGARQTHADNPAIGYFAAAAAARRRARSLPRGAGASRAPLYALFFMLLPLAVAAGVLVGRGNGNDNAALLAVLRNQKPIVVTAAGAGTAASTAATPTATASASAPSGASLGSGYVIRLQTLPTTTAAGVVTAAESAATAKGATRVGVVNPADTRTTPDQGASNYVIYSGFYATKAQATTALAALKAHFPAATVIAVAPVAATAAASGTGGGSAAVTSPKAVPQSAAQIPSKPTAASLKQGSSIVSSLSKQTGKSYVQTQEHLPKVITIPGSPSAGATSPSPSTPAAGQP